MSLKPTIDELRALGHHATTYDWGIQFISLPSAITGFTTADLNTRCSSTQLPSRNLQDIPVSLRGHKILQPGIVEYGNNLPITLYETVDSKVADFLEAYMNIEWTPLSGAQIPKTLGQSAFLLTLLDSEQNARKHYTIIGAWLKGWDPIELQSETSTIIAYQTNWAFDYYI